MTVYLSALARMRRPTREALDRSLYDDRSLVRHHGMRRTLWVATPDVVRLFHAAVTRRLFRAEHRRTARLLSESGVADPEAWLRAARDHVVAVLHEHGPSSARQIGELVPELRRPLVLAPGTRFETTVAAHTRVILQLGFEGAIVRARPLGSWVSGQYTYAAADTWLPGGLFGPGGSGGPGGPDEAEAARELAHRWLRRFGPATTADLQWWTGWSASLTRQALSGCRAVPVGMETAPGVVEAGWLASGDEVAEAGPGPWAALLPGLDPTVMGWKSRDWYLPPACREALDRNGNAGPTIWVDGQVVGVWMQGRSGEIRTRFLVDVPSTARSAVEARADQLAALVGDTRLSVRFPAPVHRALLAENGR